jgi:hypothetical protein
MIRIRSASREKSALDIEQDNRLICLDRADARQKAARRLPDGSLVTLLLVSLVVCLKWAGATVGIYGEVPPASRPPLIERTYPLYAQRPLVIAITSVTALARRGQSDGWRR